MRNFIYLLFLLLTVGLVSCRKDKVSQNIKQYDQAQIQAYITSKGYTGMKRDTVGGDTSGIYYQVLTPGTGGAIDYSTPISFTYTINSLDGTYSLTDTIMNHTYAYAGETSPPGLLLALHDLVKQVGTRIHIIIPSHLAYGVYGSGTGSTRLTGNQSLDYYINVVNSGLTYSTALNNYDDLTIQNYIKAHNYTGYTKITTGDYAGMYYKIRTPGTGTIPVINSSIVSFDYRSQLMNANVVEPSNYSLTTGVVSTTATYYMSNLDGQTLGLRQGLFIGAVSGTQFSLILPSRLAYGLKGVTNEYPAHSCVFYDVTIDSVTD
jgi:FKBP-type peptidyl-prolyl cis-trans isomerase FkpA